MTHVGSDRLWDEYKILSKVSLRLPDDDTLPTKPASGPEQPDPVSDRPGAKFSGKSTTVRRCRLKPFQNTDCMKNMPKVKKKWYYFQSYDRHLVEGNPDSDKYWKLDRSWNCIFFFFSSQIVFGLPFFLSFLLLLLLFLSVDLCSDKSEDEGFPWCLH